MKSSQKIALVLLTLVPIVIGYIINFILRESAFVGYYVLPCMVLIFWFFLGKQFSRTNWRLALSLLISSVSGVLSVCLYWWQFVVQGEAVRNMIIAKFSQMYMASVPTFLVSILFRPFLNSFNNLTTTESIIVLQLIAIIMMMVVFGAGFMWGKRQLNK